MQSRFNLKILLTGLLSLLLILSFSSSVMAVKGPPGVAKTWHNLSSTAIISSPPYTPAFSQYRSDEDEICVFCHTPHGGSLTGPLWNRSDPDSSWSNYNSATISDVIKTLGASRVIEDESLLCMSCHDGSIGVYHVLNLPNGRDGAVINKNDGSEPDLLIQKQSALIGASSSNPTAVGDLTDDHPISFSYSEVQTSSKYQSGSKTGNLSPIFLFSLSMEWST